MLSIEMQQNLKSAWDLSQHWLPSMLLSGFATPGCWHVVWVPLGVTAQHGEVCACLADYCECFCHGNPLLS